MRINYVLVDFENVQPDSIGLLAGEQFKVLVFVGANQTKLSFDIASALQKLGTQAEYIKISGNGANALDFHIAYYIGVLAAQQSSAYFHIISKDKGFDPLIQHLRSRKIFAGRVASITEIPIVKASNSTTSEEKTEVVLLRLQQLKASKPRTVKTLISTIGALFQKKLQSSEIDQIVAELERRQYLAIQDSKVSYTLPNNT
ncbi:MAG: hypothetical protein H7A06_05715 [Pseudomonadales bacterium]|nr:hypothetical protein [Pseudomonadales bacterium]